MKNFIWAFIFLFVLSACDPVEPENIALDWTPEEQCQVWNKWSVTGREAPDAYVDLMIHHARMVIDNIFIDEAYYSSLRLHAPLDPFDENGWTLTGDCADDGMMAVYPRH